LQMNGLPVVAADENQRRLALAEELVRACPSAFGTEAALTGSAAIGMADHYSDLELNFWAETLPSIDERAVWLRSLGATDVSIDLELGADGTLWSTWRLQGIWIETGWQTIAAQNANLQAVLRGEVTDHARVVGASAVRDAVTLRTLGRLAAWQAQLAHYPDGLADALVAAAVERWHWSHWLDSRWALIDRGERLGFADVLIDDLKTALRVLFAVNRRWEVGVKWLRPASQALPLKPERFIERVDAVFASTDPLTSVRLCLELVLDILALAPRRNDVERARRTIQEALRQHLDD
jgi:hypothetical protein